MHKKKVKAINIISMFNQIKDPSCISSITISSARINTFSVCDPFILCNKKRNLDCNI